VILIVVTAAAAAATTMIVPWFAPCTARISRWTRKERCLAARLLRSLARDRSKGHAHRFLRLEFLLQCHPRCR
jgi:hypothetical protein